MRLPSNTAIFCEAKVPKKSLYAQTIAAKPKATAYKNPVGSASPTGDFPTPVSPREAGHAHGLGPAPSEPFKQKKAAHGWGHVAHQKHGHLRLSGYADAHRLGAKVIGKVRKAPETGK